MGSDAGGERAAAIYSLVETAKLNGLDPEPYLRDVLERVADHPHQAHRRAAAVESRRVRRGTTTSSLNMATKVQRIKTAPKDPAVAHRTAGHEARGVAPRAGT
jgi:hypothetical protein